MLTLDTGRVSVVFALETAGCVVAVSIGRDCVCACYAPPPGVCSHYIQGNVKQ